MKSIVYLGPEKTYSESAARKFGQRIDVNSFVPQMNFSAVSKCVVSESSYGVLPYYNYLEGLVQHSLDLIYERDLRIIDICRLDINHSIGGYKKEPYVIYSLPIAVEQCDDYLKKEFPDVSIVPVSSTAEGMVTVSKNGSGMAIGSKDALLHYGLEIINDSISNKKHNRSNYTDFYLVDSGKSEREFEYKGDNWLTMVAITPFFDKPGLLSIILNQISFYGINNAKIHSRPAIEYVDIAIDPQMFYVEMMCHPKEERFLRCIDSLRYWLSMEGNDLDPVRILGSYNYSI